LVGLVEALQDRGQQPWGRADQFGGVSQIAGADTADVGDAQGREFSYTIG
jgi:hypothetical protein